MNSDNSKTPDRQRLLLNLSDKINLKTSGKYAALSNHIRLKIQKIHTKVISLKYHVRYGMKSLNYLIYHILYQIFKTILNISLKKLEKKTNNHSTEHNGKL